MKEVTISSEVTVKWKDKVRIFHIVTPKEVDTTTGRISYESPLGNILIRRQVGDKVRYKNVGGELIDVEIMEIG